MRGATKLEREMVEYILTDYEFLEDYEIIDNGNSKSTFLAQIKNSTQKVRFVKRKFSQQLFPRFKVLSKLYKNGIVLADNMFIIEECEQHYFYVIEAELEPANRRFRNLQQYLYEERPRAEQRKGIISKIKILVDCLHQEGQAYAGLDVRGIIVDDEGHIYLAPFQLEVEVRNEGFSRAYYPPELLGKIESGNSEIDEMGMMRWDYWSFGCIAAEVLLYQSPFFLETSLQKQIKRIKQFAFSDELSHLEEPMKNAIVNSLTKEETARSISATQISRTKNVQNQIDLKKTVKNWKKNSDRPANDDIAQLNVYKDNQSGDSELAITFISLEGIPFKEQLHIAITLNKKYHFYIDATPQSKYKLNKVLTHRGNFKDMSKLLEEPVKVEVKEGSNSAIILANLQSLVMMHEGRRLWNKQLLGTYKTDKESDFPHGKLKISCVLNSPDCFIEQTSIPVEKIPQNEVSLNIEPLVSNVLAQVTNTVPSAAPKKKREKAQSRCDIPSISQISKSISSITQHFLKKLSSNPPIPPSEDPLKDKLERILDIS